MLSAVSAVRSSMPASLPFGWGTSANKPVRAQHQCLKPCESDPTGHRALQDLIQYEDCPIQEILQGEEIPDHVIKAREAHEQLQKDMATFETIKNGTGSVESVLSKFEKTHFFNKEGRKESMKVYLRDKKENAVKTVAEFLLLVDMYTELSKIPAVRRAAMYCRRIDPQDGQVKTSYFMKAYYIAWPCVVFFFSFGFQSFMLHIATHFYIYYMDHGPKNRREGGGQLLDLVGNWVAENFVENPDKKGAVTEGAVLIPMTILDISGGVPLMLCVVSFLLTGLNEKFNIGLWCKTFLVASMLAVLKGIFDVVTILPDSIGWDSCTSRLGETGLAQLRNIKFLRHGWDALFTAMYHEVVGGSGGRRVRYCADMMISGHTYFAMLFALSAYKQVSFLTEGRNTWYRRFRQAVGVVCLFCITTEVLLVAAARFHYTVDMLASIVLVVLLWDSSTVEQIAADWSEGFHWQDSKNFLPRMAPITWMIRRWSYNISDEKKAEKEAIVLPSQSSLLNMRVLQGCAAWNDPHDFVLSRSAEPAASPKQGTTGTGVNTQRGEQTMPLMEGSVDGP